MSKLSRRETLAGGGKVIAAAAVLPFVPSTAHAKEDAPAQEDAELFALFDEYKRLERVEIKASDKLHHALSEAGLNASEVSKSFLTASELVRRAYSGRAKELERTGIPALEKKHETAKEASLDVLSRLYDVRAHTPEGMILKLMIERTDRDRRSRRAKGHPGRKQFTGAEYFSQGPASVLMDIERLLSGRRI